MSSCNLLRDIIVYTFEEPIFFDRILKEVDIGGNSLDNPGNKDTSAWIPLIM